MYDKEISMYYLIARYYNPDHGVFLSVDPDPGDEDDPVTMNGYTYGDNNPVMKIDPDGHVAWWVAGALGGAAWDVGTYLWNNRKKGYSWKGVGKSALRGAVTGVALGGVGKLGAAYAAQKGYKVLEVGRIKGVRANPGHFGIRYQTPKTPPIRSIELHPNHHGHGIHIQRNVWTLNHPRNKGKLYRLGGDNVKRWGITLAYQKLKGKFNKK